MNKDFLVIYTPGAFGNFIGYIIDCHLAEKLLPSPFVKSGASHFRPGQDSRTQTVDLVQSGHQDLKHKLYEVLNQRDDIEQIIDKRVIGIVWDDIYFPYILHAYYGRTNFGQYGKCGVEFLEKNFLQFVEMHQVKDVGKNIKTIKDFFGFEVNKENPKVPRHILRQFFWFTLFHKQNNKVTIVNDKIKLMSGIELLQIEIILDYDRLKLFLSTHFNFDLDFKQLHEQFLKSNQSLKDFNKSKRIIQAVKNNQNIDTRELSVIGEAYVLYELEKYFFDIPFFNIVQFFDNTQQIIDYAKYFPAVMKQPNKLYHQYYERFPPLHVDTSE
jgi:hypothetical protein